MGRVLGSHVPERTSPHPLSLKPQPDGSRRRRGDSSSSRESSRASGEPASGEGRAQQRQTARESQPTPVPEAPEIPGYEVFEMVGRGSTGTVYRAVQQAVSREVAVKVLHPELSAKPRVVRRLQREARTLARLAHPNVVGAIDMGQAGDNWWFAMEFVEGESLADRLRAEGRLPEREVLRLFTPLADALGHLWEQGVVHRDIKPANILLDSGHGTLGGRGIRARLADLGLAFADDDPGLTGQGGVLGTPHYISPEQARDAGAVDVRTDLWAFGATLFHTLCGRPPFRGESLAEVLSSVLHARVPDPQELAPDLSNGLALVLRKCLVRDPELRYQTPLELLEDLELLRERRAPLVRKAELDPLERNGLFWRRPWLGGLLTGAAASALLAVGILKPWAEPEEPTIQDVQPLARLEPLEDIMKAARANRSLLWRATDDLERMRADLPNELGLRYYGARNELDSMLRNGVDDLTRMRSREVEEALSRSDFRRALAILERQELDLMAATGYPLDRLSGELRERLDQSSRVLGERVEAAMEPTINAISNALVARFEGVTEPRVRASFESGEWRSALQQLEFDPQVAFEEAGFDPLSLPAAGVEAAASRARSRTRRLEQSLRDSWLGEQRIWMQNLDQFQSSLRANLGFGSDLDEAGAALVEAFEELIGGSVTSREALPIEGLEVLEARLERGVRELDEAWAEAFTGGLRAALDLRLDKIAPAWIRARQYDRAVDLLLHFEQELEMRLTVASSVVEIPDGEESLQRVQLMRHEVERLAALRITAGLGIRESDGESIDLEVPVGSDPFDRRGGVRLTGILLSGLNPLEDSFQLEVEYGPRKTILVSFENLDLRDLQQFFERGLEYMKESADEAWLDRALLYYWEDDLQNAKYELLGVDKWPAEDQMHGKLVKDLKERVGRPARDLPTDAELAAQLLALLGEEQNALEHTDQTGAVAILELLSERFTVEPAVAVVLPGLKTRLEESR